MYAENRPRQLFVGCRGFFIGRKEGSVTAKRDTFSTFHPVVSLLFFALVLLFAMCWMHPADLLIGLLGALAYHVRLRGREAAMRSMAVLLPLVVLTAALNALFSHVGTTPVLSLPGGGVLTVEALLYGAAAGVMLAAVLQWFACYHQVMTSDKFMYLFGRVMPAGSLLLSMTLRLVPELRSRARSVAEAQRGLGRDIRRGSLPSRFRTAAAIFSVLITWAMENAMETADSMKSRGYGLPGRTTFSLCRFTGRDRAMLLWLLTCGGTLCAGWLCGGMQWQYYPTMQGAPMVPLTIWFRLVYLALVMTPTAAELIERAAWNVRKEGSECV